MEKKLNVLGAVGNTPFQNRDRCIVLDRGGSCKTVYAKQDHAPLVIKRYERNKSKRTNG